MDWLQFAPFAGITIADLQAAAPAVGLVAVFVAVAEIGPRLIDRVGGRK